MADVAILGGTESIRDAARWFYVYTAGLCVLIAFGLFAPTYWLQLPGGTFMGSPLLHLHAILFSGWTLFFFFQSLLIATRRTQSHRAWGMLGVSLATAMVYVGIGVAGETLPAQIEAGYGDQKRAFMILPLSDLFLFASLVAIAVANMHRPAAHKRLMLLATVAILPAAMARTFFSSECRHRTRSASRPGTAATGGSRPHPLADGRSAHRCSDVL